ncbi:hypothetical protein BH18ACT1_BH18ACT1_09390 [soil metagenome]
MAEPDRLLRFVLTPASAELRRRLGPTPWAVLEDVLLHGDVANGAVVASTSVRAVASRLGLARATAGRALGRLLGEGLLVRNQDRRRRGTFGRATYECLLDALDGIDVLIAPENSTSTKPGVPTVVPSRRSTAQQHRHQPTLFPENPDTDRHPEADNSSTISCTHRHPAVPGLPNRFPREDGLC